MQFLGSVSILVFVELALDVEFSVLLHCGIPIVSILVFVELALDVRRVEANRYKTLCFNPCFRGTCS